MTETEVGESKRERETVLAMTERDVGERERERGAGARLKSIF